VKFFWSNLGFRSFPKPLDCSIFFHIKSITFVTIIVKILTKWYNISMNKAYRYKLELEMAKERRLYQAKQEGRERRRKEKEERTPHYLFNLPNNIPKLANKSDK
jgi:hypothetical protein